MFSNNFYAMLSLVCCIQLLGANAYPVINARRLFDSVIEGRYKKSDLNFPQTDEDVSELEHLKHNRDDNNDDGTSSQLAESAVPVVAASPSASAEEDSMNHSDLLPELEHQLEAITTSEATLKTDVTIINNMPTDTERSAKEEQSSGVSSSGGAPQHRPPMLQHHDGGKIPINQQSEMGEIEAPAAPAIPSMTKPFYGAARLAFGQNPEVLPTLTSSTSTSTTTAAYTSTTNANIPDSFILSPAASEDIATAIPPPGSLPSHPLRQSNSDQDKIHTSVDSPTPPQNENNKEEVGDVVVDQLEATKTQARRSVTLMPPKTADSLFKHKDGQYSSFDMAQYVFWTGDEAGVARAVEEFIEQGLMSREHAIKFLRDIRLGIEYLQNSYLNHMFPNEMRENNIKKNLQAFASTMHTITATETTTTTPKPTPVTTRQTTEKPFPEVHAGRTNDRRNVHLEKTLEMIPSLIQLQEMDSARKQDTSEYGESVGRAKIAEFLYTEYSSLEDVIYKLAKVMFSQSLAHGSDEAQQELQRLTDFLQEEGERGNISANLQKKVLDVLLSALSDTLIAHPELLAAARSNLGNSFHKIPVNSLDPIRN